jgi:hypothetical protein
MYAAIVQADAARAEKHRQEKQKEKRAKEAAEKTAALIADEKAILVHSLFFHIYKAQCIDHATTRYDFKTRHNKEAWATKPKYDSIVEIQLIDDRSIPKEVVSKMIANLKLYFENMLWRYNNYQAKKNRHDNALEIYVQMQPIFEALATSTTPLSAYYKDCKDKFAHSLDLYEKKIQYDYNLTSFDKASLSFNEKKSKLPKQLQDALGFKPTDVFDHATRASGKPLIYLENTTYNIQLPSAKSGGKIEHVYRFDLPRLVVLEGTLPLKNRGKDNAMVVHLRYTATNEATSFLAHPGVDGLSSLSALPLFFESSDS